MISIRRADPRDAASLASFASRTFTDTFGAMNRPEDLADYLGKTYGEELQRCEIQDPRVITLLAEENRELVAFAQLKIESPERVEIARFYVDQSWHGRGVARSMMNAVIDEVRAAGAKTVWLGVWEHNHRAIAFYAKCGFRDTGSHPFLLGSDLQTDRVMARDLERGDE